MTAISASPGSPHGPFIGPRPFDSRAGSRFFGRDAEIGELAETWRRNRLTILHGAAGVGKTSMLRAGVVPELRAWNAHVLPVGLAAPSRVWPTAALPDQNPYVLALLSSWAHDEPLPRVAGLSVGDFLRRHERIDQYGKPAATLAAVDQVEGLLREPAAHEHHRGRFLDDLFETLDRRPNLHLLLAVRDEYLDRLLRVLKGYPGPPFAEFTLRPFDPATAADVVRRSAQAAGEHMPAEHVEALLGELGTIGDDGGDTGDRTAVIDPLLLQVAGASSPGVPSAEGVDRALADFCARALAEITAEHALPRDRFVTWFRDTLLAPGGGVPSASAGVTAAVVHALEDAHLVSVSHQDGVRVRAPHRPRLLSALLRTLSTGWPALPIAPHDLLRAAVRAVAEGEPGRARDLAREAARLCPPDAVRMRAEIETQLGNIAYEQDLLDQASAHYQAAASVFEALGDSTAVAWLLAAVGRVALVQGREGAAVEHLRSAVNRVPHDLIVQTALAQVLWQTGQSQAALSVLDNVLSREADTPEARRTRGEILADLGQAESALRDIGKLHSRPTEPSTRAAHALALATLSREEVAALELDTVIADARDSGPVLLRAARVRKLTGDAGEAARLADRAMTARHPPLPAHQRSTALHLLKER